MLKRSVEWRTYSVSWHCRYFYIITTMFRVSVILDSLFRPVLTHWLKSNRKRYSQQCALRNIKISSWFKIIVTWLRVCTLLLACADDQSKTAVGCVWWVTAHAHWSLHVIGVSAWVWETYAHNYVWLSRHLYASQYDLYVVFFSQHQLFCVLVSEDVKM